MTTKNHGSSVKDDMQYEGPRKNEQGAGGEDRAHA
jgi:hypothetical protein